MNTRISAIRDASRTAAFLMTAMMTPVSDCAVQMFFVTVPTAGAVSAPVMSGLRPCWERRAVSASTGGTGSALQPAGLPVHVLDHDVVDLAQRRAVFQDLPGLVGVEMNLDQILVAHRQKAVAFEMLRDVVADLILVEIVSFDQKLRVITKFHGLVSFSLLGSAGRKGLPEVLIRCRRADLFLCLPCEAPFIMILTDYGSVCNEAVQKKKKERARGCGAGARSSKGTPAASEIFIVCARRERFFQAEDSWPQTGIIDDKTHDHSHMTV